MGGTNEQEKMLENDQIYDSSEENVDIDRKNPNWKQRQLIRRRLGIHVSSY